MMGIRVSPKIEDGLSPEQIRNAFSFSPCEFVGPVGVPVFLAIQKYRFTISIEDS